MKIITKNAAYVQKNDIAYLYHTNIEIPASIFIKVFGKDIVIIDDNNRYEFEKFEDANEIEFFSKLDWIVDYNLVKDLSVDQIIEVGKQLAQTKNQIAKKFNAMSQKNRMKNYEMVTQCELLDFEMHSLRDIVLCKQGYLDMDLPKDFNRKKENIIQKLKLKRIFSNKRN